MTTQKSIRAMALCGSGAWAKVDVGLLRDDVLSRHDAARCRCAGASVERSGGAPADVGLVFLPAHLAFRRRRARTR